MRRILMAVFAVLLYIEWTAAADIRAVHRDCFFHDKCESKYFNTVLLLGTIVPGDHERFRSAMKKDLTIDTVILRSKGGNVVEAMEIGRDIRRLLLETEGPHLDYYREGSLAYEGGDYPLCIENGVRLSTGRYTRASRFKGTDCVCASACFLIYAAGARRDRSYVGIHRSYISEKATRDLGLDTASQIYSKIRKPIEDYLDEMSVPRRYADIMLRTSSQEIYVPKFPEIMRDFYGWIPEVEEWLIARCKTMSERQLAEEEARAFAAGRSALQKFIKFRNHREGCIQLELLEERLKRRRAVLQ